MNDDYNRLNSGEELTETGNILYLGEELSETRNILNLSTFYDAEHSVLRVGGRLSQCSLSENKKLPPLVAKNFHTGSSSTEAIPSVCAS